MTPDECLSVLGLKPGATPPEIKKAYKRLARQYHPDLNPNNKLAEYRFRLAKEAYDSLLDPEFHLAHKKRLPPKPVAEPTSLDFGELYEDSVRSLTFTVHNEGGTINSGVDLKMSDPASWFSWEVSNSQPEDYCPFDVSITVHGSRLKGKAEAEEFIDVEFDRVSTRVTLHARFRARETKALRVSPPQSTTTFTYTPGKETKPPKPKQPPPKREDELRKQSREQTPDRRRKPQDPPPPKPQVKRREPPPPALSQPEPDNVALTILVWVVAGVLALSEFLLFLLKKAFTRQVVAVGIVLCGTVFVFSQCGAVLNYLQRNTPGHIQQAQPAQQVPNSSSTGQSERRPRRERSSGTSGGTSSAQPAVSKSVDHAPTVQQTPAPAPTAQTEVIQLPHRLSPQQCAERKAARKRGEYPYIPPECNAP